MLVILLLRFIMQSLTMIVTDAEHIILDNNHTGQLTISATESEGDKNQVFLFKVKILRNSGQMQYYGGNLSQTITWNNPAQ